jgi:hypothetical protein
MTDDKPGFVPLKALREGPSVPDRVLAEIRDIYFKTTKRTIQHDLAHAIALLKTLPTEEERERARVYMDGLAQMRTEWAVQSGRSRGSGRSGKVRRTIREQTKK